METNPPFAINPAPNSNIPQNQKFGKKRINYSLNSNNVALCMAYPPMVNPEIE